MEHSVGFGHSHGARSPSGGHLTRRAGLGHRLVEVLDVAARLVEQARGVVVGRVWILVPVIIVDGLLATSAGRRWSAQPAQERVPELRGADPHVSIHGTSPVRARDDGAELQLGDLGEVFGQP